VALREAKRHLQQLLRGEQEARLEAQATSRAKDQFLAVLGHELRSPLSALAYSALGLRRGPLQTGEAERLQGTIERQTRYLTRLVNDLLDVSRFDSGKVEVGAEIVDLKEAAERCLAVLQATGRITDHAVTTELEPAWVRVDPTRLEQIVTNLLENAANYTPAGGMIRVSAGREGKHAVLRVTDSGRGIDADILPRIFDFFAQADDALDRSHGGLGIGLTIVRRLVELHGGAVEARSAGRDRGSEFVVRFPLEEPRRSPPAATVPSATNGTIRVLVVEDYADARLALQELLESFGHEVATAEDGRRGLEKAIASPFDVAFVDIGLPELDGFAVAEAIRAHESGDGRPRIRLFAITGYGQSDVRRRALEAGFDDCLVKPVDPAELLRLLAEDRRAS
jgi:CheY-like chemotaxis protein/nitrogen-specific signal transduction histidine kinase